MKRVPVNWSVILFLMNVIYFLSTANMSCWMIARSNPLVSWKTCRFFIILVFHFLLGVVGRRYKDAEVSCMELTNKGGVYEESISGRAYH